MIRVTSPRPGWQVIISPAPVATVAFADGDLCLAIGVDSQQLKVSIGGRVRITTEQHQLCGAAASDKVLASAQQLVGKTLLAMRAEDDGLLELVFSGGNRLRAEPDPDVEAWEVSAPGGVFLTAIAGGGVAAWGGSADSIGVDQGE